MEEKRKRHHFYYQRAFNFSGAMQLILVAPCNHSKSRYKNFRLSYYRPQTKFAKVMLYRCLSVHRGEVCGCEGVKCGCRGCVWLWGACVVAGGHVAPRGCAWLPGGMHGCWGACMVAGGYVWLPGVCVVAGGHAWLPGGVHGCPGEHAWLPGRHAWLPGGVHRIRRDTVNERAVRILLECILVIYLFSSNF